MSNNPAVPYLYCPARNTPNDQEACRACRFHEAESALQTASGPLPFVLCTQHGGEQASPVLAPEGTFAQERDAAPVPVDLTCRIRDLDAGGHLAGRAVELRGHHLIVETDDDIGMLPGAHVQLRVVLSRSAQDCPAEWVFGGRAIRITRGDRIERRRIELILRRGSAPFVAALADREGKMAV
jgi:hypothetical protein